MIYMKNKGRTVFVIGAGFSAPANLPIQNRILREITQPTSKDFLSFDPDPESLKLMLSYIRVGLYLLQNYTNIDCGDEIISFSALEREIVLQNSDSMQQNNTFREIQLQKESIRSKLEAADLQISLEDIFTSFDKSYQGKEYLYQKSYYQIDEVRDAITRLFVYYFSKRINTHSFDYPEYINFCKYIKNQQNATIISTNWDVLIEEYFSREKIAYNLCLNEPYYTPSSKTKDSSSTVNLIKLHGSINWFKCLNCGTLNIVDNQKCGRFLFDDSAEEICAQCHCKASNGPLLQAEIITPTMMKTINSQLYNNLWSAAKRDLMSATRVIFIGYSLPIADFELRYLLQRSIPSEVIIDIVLHHSDNPANTNFANLKSLLPEKRYRDLFAKNEMNFFYNGFDDYFTGKSS